MVKKIIHTADIHIRTFRLHSEYMEVFKTFISDAKELVKDYERDEVRIILAGDLVHQKILISNEQLLLCTWFIKELEKIAPVIIIAGNHDLLENNKSRMDSITPVVKFLSDLNVNYFKESKCYLDDNIVWCVYSIFEVNAKPDIDSAREEFGDDKIYIGLYHAALLNAKTDIGYSIDHGSGLDIFDGCDAVMMGDIHLYQVFIHKGAPIIYPGSLIQQNFGEKITGHGFVLWDITEPSDLTYEFHEVENRHRYFQFKITSLDDLETGSEKITNK